MKRDTETRVIVYASGNITNEHTRSKIEEDIKNKLDIEHVIVVNSDIVQQITVLPQSRS